MLTSDHHLSLFTLRQLPSLILGLFAHFALQFGAITSEGRGKSAVYGSRFLSRSPREESVDRIASLDL